MYKRPDVIDKMIDRKSARDFTGEGIDASMLEDILRAAQNAPTSIYGQQVSVIVIEDKARLEALANLIASKAKSKVQRHIVDAGAFLLFTSDFNKMHKVLEYEGQDLGVVENIEALLTGAVDVGIALEAATQAAECMGLGTVCIGGIRAALSEAIEFCSLPRLVLPICGLCIGVLDRPRHDAKPKKLRLPLCVYAHKDRYRLDDFASVIASYNALTDKEVYAGRFVWSKNIAAYYHGALNAKNAEVIKKQGYSLS